MELGAHVWFIIAAYMTAALVVLALIAWVLADYAAQRRRLAELEQRGATRRSKPQETA